VPQMRGQPRQACRDGADIAALMPRLSTYLGHTDPQHTFWYLSAAPELMALAGQRLEAHLAGGRS
jgi:integrase/recombinase XerD